MSAGRLTSIWAWTEEGPGGEGVIAAAHPALGGMVVNLQHRRRELAYGMRAVAEQHRRRTGSPVRFVRFDRAEDEETLP